MAGDDRSANLVRGTVDLMVLRALSTGAMHGYAIWRWIEENGGEAVRLEDAALYQALHRLQRQGLLDSRWGRSENNRRARFYELTEAGRGRLRQEVAAWSRYRDAVQALLEGL